MLCHNRLRRHNISRPNKSSWKVLSRALVKNFARNWESWSNFKVLRISIQEVDRPFEKFLPTSRLKTLQLLLYKFSFFATRHQLSSLNLTWGRVVWWSTSWLTISVMKYSWSTAVAIPTFPNFIGADKTLLFDRWCKSLLGFVVSFQMMKSWLLGCNHVWWKKISLLRNCNSQSIWWSAPVRLPYL